MLATIPELSGLPLRQLKRHVGTKTYDRGHSYARGDRVLSLEFDSDELVLTASVRGHGAMYETTVFFEADGDDGLDFVEGECTCPIGYDCKHVAAIVIAAAEERGGRGPGATHARRAAGGPAVRPGRSAPPPVTWEQPLRALVAARATGAVGAPLAIELKLATQPYPADGQLRLMARLMRPGARGGWVNGSLDWNGLDAWRVRDAGYREDHLALVRELHAVHCLRQARGYYYGYGPADRSIELSACESPQLWPLLEEAARLDLPLIHADPAQGRLPGVRDGEVVLDVTRARARGWQVAAVLRTGEGVARDLVPIRLIGQPGHGIVCAERADVEAIPEVERWRLRLVRLARPAPGQLEQMLLGRSALEVPAGEIERFATELCPALRHIAPVVSSDGSFEPPAVSEPSLVLQTRYGDGTAVEVGWAWAYEVAGRARREPLGEGEGAAEFRDFAAEQAALGTVALSGTGLERFGLIDGDGRPATGSPVVLRGTGGLALATEVLPALPEQAGIEIEVGGSPPDYRDVGESVEIGVATGAIVGERDWFDLDVSIAVEGREIPFVEVFTALALGEPRLVLDDGAHFSLQTPRLQALGRLIDEARALLERPPGEPLRISRWQADLWSELVSLGVVREQAERWERLVAPLLELESLPDPAVPSELRAELRPYQREGFAWLAALWELELGGILADDMGLGKTVQALALICHARAAAPFLVVAPTSVAPNWVAEAARFAPELRVELVADTLARSGRAIEDVARADVVVTTYTLYRLECEAYRSVPWAGLILDEAQFVKNHRGKTYRCARELDTPFKLAITGTPMENSVMELWAMLSIVAPGLFPDPARFGEHYARPIERRADPERLDRLRRRIKPLVKRRTKEVVAAELPAKQEQTLTLELHPRHRKLYDTRLQRERAKILALLEDFDRNRFTILTSITRLRQLSLHPALVDASHRMIPCAKLDALVEQLDDVIAGGHRALVFSQFTQFLALVRERLDAHQIGHCYLDGSTRRRAQVLERFRSGEDPVFLISLKAGGVGLNLVQADYCFLLDPWWNPATEVQAIDRAHRIGQTRPVNVYRLIAAGTIEEKVRALADRKAQLFHGVMDDGDLFARGLTAEDIRGLLG